MKKEIEAAVSLWAEQITKGVQDNGDGMQSMFAQLLKKQTPVTDAQIESFKNELTLLLAAALEKRPSLTIGVDYDPDEILGEACIKSGVRTQLLPIKSVMWIKEGSVNYKFGYSSQVTNHDLN